jgi:CDP-paratose 2-epimerase
VFLSTNKVYGDAPNEVPRVEAASRYDYARPEDRHGIDETCRLDASMHSLFGASKAAADLLVQEYGRYFGMPTVCFRAGCMTGAHHAGVELHGFLSWLVKSAVAGRVYTVFGHGGKQVRDQIHADDVCAAIELWLDRPTSAAVYNLGGGRASHASILECFALLGELLGRPVAHRFDAQARAGDHVCYVSDTRRFQADHPAWRVTSRVPDLLAEMVRAESGEPRARALRLTARPGVAFPPEPCSAGQVGTSPRPAPRL